jgi:hypothetical protein
LKKKKDGMILFDGELKDEKMVWDEAGTNEYEIVEHLENGDWSQDGDEILEAEKKADSIRRKAKKDANEIRVEALAQSMILRSEGNTFLQKKANQIAAKQNLKRENERASKMEWDANKQADVIIANAIEENKADIKDKLFKEDGQDEKGDQSYASVKKDINYYILSGSQLGWINCDRFTRNNAEKVTFRVNPKGSEIDVKLIFYSVKGVMAGYREQESYIFNRVPIGEKVTVFAVKFINNKPFVCLQDLKVSQETVDLDFEELTKEKLQDYAKRINGI